MQLACIYDIARLAGTYEIPQRDSSGDEPEQNDEAGHPQDKQPCSVHDNVRA